MAVGLHRALVQTYHAQKNRTRPGMAKIGLSPGQPKILNHLSKRNHCMQKDIAEALDIEPATVSQILNNMDGAGLVRRSDCAERRRAESVSITEKGQKALQEWQRLCGEIEEVSLRGFTPEERERFLDYLCRMYRNLTGKSLE